MPILRIQHSVPSFEGWKRAFDSDPMGRKASGVRRYHVHRSLADPNLVMIDLEFETVAEAERLLERLGHLWAGPGGAVMQNPVAWIIETVESRSLQFPTANVGTEVGLSLVLGTKFAHRAVWNAADSRIEMHLVARRAQAIQVPAAGIEFSMAEGESIWTESSYKYEPGDVTALLAAAGFHPTGQWLDPEARFALTLADAR